MTGDAPLCTIAIPVYHRMDKALAFAAIESALAEPRRDLEILVIDDCTTDGTWDRLSRISDPRARVLRNARNLGLFANFNRCLDEARGRYVRILCSDDVLEPGTLDDELAVMELHPDVALVTTRGLRMTPDGAVQGVQARALPEGYYRGEHGIAAVLRGNSATGYNTLNYPSGVLLRKSAADAAGRFRPDMQMSGDVEYFLRMLQVGALAVLDRVGCRITVHGDQVGTRLSLEPRIMQEQFSLVDSFQRCLGSVQARNQVRRWIAGISVLQAVRSLLALDPRSAVAHLGVARRNGVGIVGMIAGFARLLTQRARWTLRGPFVPGLVAPDGPL
jgi:hypothetical protein